MVKGGEVFFLDMGASVKIVDLARCMIQLSGFKVKDKAHPYGDIEIIFTGLRPGEKLYEDTDHPLIMQAMESSFPLADIEKTLNELAQRAQY